MQKETEAKDRQLYHAVENGVLSLDITWQASDAKMNDMRLLASTLGGFIVGGAIGDWLGPNFVWPLAIGLSALMFYISWADVKREEEEKTERRIQGLLNELAGLAGKFRSASDEDVGKVAREYRARYTELRNLGYDLSLAPEDELPDNKMPKAHWDWIQS